MKNGKQYIELAERILEGRSPGEDSIYLKILSADEADLPAIMTGAGMLREESFGRKIHLCTICNGKSGRCSEDCRFCSQSSFSRTDAPVFSLLSKQELLKVGLHAGSTPINRYSIVTAGKGLSRREVEIVAGAMAELEEVKIKKCASLGIIGEEELKILLDAGVTRYHHNLEACKSLFNEVCTTHSYQERARTIRAAKKVGMEVCAGGIFGIGETDEQVLELARDLRALEVDSIPLNFLVPIKGTPFDGFNRLTPARCLKIIAFFRYFLPEKEILICGGREYNLKDLHPLVFFAGASGIMTGNYLTTEGRTLEKDLEMLEQLGLEVRDK